MVGNAGKVTGQDRYRPADASCILQTLNDLLILDSDGMVGRGGMGCSVSGDGRLAFPPPAPPGGGGSVCEFCEMKAQDVNYVGTFLVVSEPVCGARSHETHQIH